MILPIVKLFFLLVNRSDETDRGANGDRAGLRIALVESNAERLVSDFLLVPRRMSCEENDLLKVTLDEDLFNIVFTLLSVETLAGCCNGSEGSSSKFNSDLIGGSCTLLGIAGFSVGDCNGVVKGVSAGETKFEIVGEFGTVGELGLDFFLETKSCCWSLNVTIDVIDWLLDFVNRLLLLGVLIGVILCKRDKEFNC